MSLIFAGTSRCVFCNELLDAREAYGAFPAFIGDRADPLFWVSDSGFHMRCLNQSEAGKRALMRHQEWAAKTGPGKRKCIVCGEEVMDHLDYIFIPYLCAPEVHPVGSFNYTHLHRSHLGAWARQNELIELLADAQDKAILSSEYADQLRADLTAMGALDSAKTPE